MAAGGARALPLRGPGGARAALRPAAGPRAGLLAVRVLRPPVELEVLVAGGPAVAADALKDGDPSPSARTTAPCRPLEIRPLTQGEAVRRLRIQGRVKVASGPWGLEEGW